MTKFASDIQARAPPQWQCGLRTFLQGAGFDPVVDARAGASYVNAVAWSWH
jgi:hypothetical protein